MDNWRTSLPDSGQRSRDNRTGDRSGHGGTNHLSGDQIITPAIFLNVKNLLTESFAQMPGFGVSSAPPVAQARGQARSQPAKVSQAKKTSRHRGPDHLAPRAGQRPGDRESKNASR